MSLIGLAQSQFGGWMPRFQRTSKVNDYIFFVSSSAIKPMYNGWRAVLPAHMAVGL